MKAMLLAAGYGTRMRPLTDSTPKPMLAAGGKPLLVHLIEQLRAAGIREFVINHAWLGEQIEAALGDGSDFSASIQWSREGEPLETGGALIKALPLLGNEPFLLVNGDIWTDFPFEHLLEEPLLNNMLGRLVLVPNPEHNPAGDFVLESGLLRRQDKKEPRDQEGFTFCGISVLDPRLLSSFMASGEDVPVFPLRDAFYKAIDSNQLTGEIYRGHWWDIGTPERLAQLDAWLRQSP